ncbi:hypothetical protein HPB49_026632 [Dermacentor silvarum]|nr:hypothetical protein HPB49_026632 [Dermacentor silvarum]
MSHVLVKWAEENKWDIYPITCITDVAVGYRLFTQENAMDESARHNAHVQIGRKARTLPLLSYWKSVDIGGGVVVEEAIIHGLRRNCAGAPAKFARGLMRHLFTAEELRGKSLFGRRSNAHPSAPQREALDPAKVIAIIGFTVAEYQADPMRLKSSLSSLLSRELK